jgi:hypothetical protein
MGLHVAGGKVHGEVAPQCRVGQEILLDDFGLVTQAQHKPSKAEPGVRPHDVPMYRIAADLDHRLGAKLSLFTKSRTQSTAEHKHWNIGRPRHLHITYAFSF